MKKQVWQLEGKEIGLAYKEKGRKEDEIIQLYLSGKKIPEICKETKASFRRVNTIVTKGRLEEKAKKFLKESAKAVLEEKIPLLKEIASLSLMNVRDFLGELSDPVKRSERLSTMKDARDLAAIASQLNEMLRLELGQSTSITETVSYSFEAIKVLLTDLSKVDPIFDYPKFLDGPKESANTGTDPSPDKTC